jgi:hypothetical protein
MLFKIKFAFERPSFHCQEKQGEKKDKMKE